MPAPTPPPTDAAIAVHVAQACAAWPSLAIDERTYRAWLVEALATQRAGSVPFADCPPAEVALCWAAGRGDAEALRLIEVHYFTLVPVALRQFQGGPAFVDEILQRVRVKLLVGRGGEPAPVARYAFGGSLLGLLRVAAMREAISVKRGDIPAVPLDHAEELADELDPELRSLKARYAVDFQRAFAAALAELPARDRRLLRLNISVKASIDDIARMYQTHRATAARWLTAARDDLAARTRAHLQASLGLADGEVQSLLRLVRTEASRMLATIPPGDDELHDPL